MFYFHRRVWRNFTRSELENILLVMSVADIKEVFFTGWYLYFLFNIYWQGFISVIYTMADFYFIGPFDTCGELSVNLLHFTWFEPLDMEPQMRST